MRGLAIYGTEDLAAQGNGELGTAMDTRRSGESPGRRRHEVGDAPDSRVPPVGVKRKRGCRIVLNEVLLQLHIILICLEAASTRYVDGRRLHRRPATASSVVQFAS